MPFMVMLILAIICPIRNNRVLESFSEQLYDYELPPYTTIVEKHELCGKLTGDKENMDFVAAVLLETDLEEAEIKGYYFKKMFKSAKENGGTPSIEIVKPKGALLQSHYLTNQDIYFESLEEISNLEHYIVIVLSDGGYKSWFDYRGN